MPDRQAALPLSFRPMTKICMDYVTSAAPEPLPASGNMVYPPGGQIYPPDRYLAAIDNESLLRRQDRPLGTCEKDQWLPSPRGELFQSSVPMSMTPAPTSRMIDELSMPKVLIKPTSNKCRIEQTPRDRLPFNNATKMQKYNK